MSSISMSELTKGVTTERVAEIREHLRLGLVSQDGVRDLLLLVDDLRLEAQCRTVEANKYWSILCDTVMAMGKVAPEAAPYADQWANKMRHDLVAARARINQLEGEREHWRLSSVCREKDARVKQLEAALSSCITELERINQIKDGQPLVSHNLLRNAYAAQKTPPNTVSS